MEGTLELTDGKEHKVYGPGSRCLRPPPLEVIFHQRIASDDLSGSRIDKRLHFRIAVEDGGLPEEKDDMVAPLEELKASEVTNVARSTDGEDLHCNGEGWVERC